MTRHRDKHEMSLVDTTSQVTTGDLLFLISCHEIVGPKLRERFKHTLVLHASDLPLGRGWSPHIWEVLQGADRITVTLLEAQDGVDCGDIWAKETFLLEGHELYNEIDEKLFATELRLMDYAVSKYELISPQAQDPKQATSYPRRKPEDSRINPHLPLAEQFDLLRVANPDRFPAFFDLRGKRYHISISKAPSP
jgi:methionyl-tRNA formyltransferase